MTLIQDTLEAVTKRLNAYFQAVDPAIDDWAILSNIVDEDGQLTARTTNKIVVYVANIQQDTTISTWKPAVPSGANRYAVIQPPIYIQLYILFFANFSGPNYPRGLGMISQTIQFFQENPYFDHQNLPDLPSPIDKLAFEFTNLDAVDLNYLMGLAGVKYLPSVYYKVRILPFMSDAIQAQVPAARGYGLSEASTDPEQTS